MTAGGEPEPGSRGQEGEELRRGELASSKKGEDGKNGQQESDGCWEEREVKAETKRCYGGSRGRANEPEGPPEGGEAGGRDNPAIDGRKVALEVDLP